MAFDAYFMTAGAVGDGRRGAAARAGKKKRLDDRRLSRELSEMSRATDCRAYRRPRQRGRPRPHLSELPVHLPDAGEFPRREEKRRRR